MKLPLRLGPSRSDLGLFCSRFRLLVLPNEPLTLEQTNGCCRRCPTSWKCSQGFDQWWFSSWGLLPPETLRFLIATRIVDVIGLVEIDFAHDVLSIDLCLFIGNVLVLDECLGEFCFCDYSISLEVDPMEAADNRILVFVLNYEIDHEDQDSQLKISYFQGAEMSHLFKNVEHAFMILGWEDLLLFLLLHPRMGKDFWYSYSLRGILL